MPDFDINRLNNLSNDDRVRVEAELAKTLDRQLGIVEMPVRPATNRNNFQAALTKLATDANYREQAQSDPALITTDFKLSLKELQALRQVAILSGADTKSVDRLRADLIVRGGVATAIDSVDVSCCSCCCCCCGDTAVSLTG